MVKKQRTTIITDKNIGKKDIEKMKDIEKIKELSITGPCSLPAINFRKIEKVAAKIRIKVNI